MHTLAKERLKVGLVQINNSFSGQNYLPYSVGLLQAYVQKHAADPDRYDFLLPVYKRMPVRRCGRRSWPMPTSSASAPTSGTSASRWKSPGG